MAEKTTAPNSNSSEASARRLLMTIIRSMASSSTAEDYAQSRANLVDAYQQSDRNLTELLMANSADIHQMMNIHTAILGKLNKAKVKLIEVRLKLQASKELLGERSAEIAELARQQMVDKAMLDLFQRVQRVAALPKQVENYIEQKYFLHAAQCCTDGLRQLGVEESCSSPVFGDTSTGALSDIEALSDVRAELLDQKEAIFDRVIEELHRHLYLIPAVDVYTPNAMPFPRSSDQAAGNLELTRQVFAMTLLRDDEATARRGQKEDQPSSCLFPASTASTSDDDDPEEDSRAYMLMLTKCLGLLNKIPDAVEVISERSTVEFINVAIKTAQKVAADNTTSKAKTHAPTSSTIPLVLPSSALLGHSYSAFSHLTRRQPGPPKLPPSSLQLQHFFDLLTRQYEAIIALHESIVLPSLKKIESALHDANSEHSPLTAFYTGDQLWDKVQMLLQQLLLYYLDAANLPVHSLFSQEGTLRRPRASNVSSFFSPRSSPAAASRFNFAHSFLGTTWNEFLAEKLLSPSGTDEWTTSAALTSPSAIFTKLNETLRSICHPSPDNLALLYDQLMKFVQLHTTPDEPTVPPASTLEGYLLNAGAKFTATIYEQLDQMMARARKSLDHVTTLTLDECKSKSTGSFPPLLEGVVLVDVATRELLALMAAMPDFGHIFLRYICHYMAVFKEDCFCTYYGIVNQSQGGGIISAKWAQDEHITQRLQSLTSWKALKDHQKSTSQLIASLVVSINKTFNLTDISSDELESPEEKENVLYEHKEAAMFILDLLQKAPELLSHTSHNQLYQLAQLQESVEWMAARVEHLLNCIERMTLPSEHIDQTHYVDRLTEVNSDLAHLGETILLVLHLELHLHCFNHLRPVNGNFFDQPAQEIEVSTDDPLIGPLLATLARLSDQLQRASLQSHKMLFLFVSLDHFLASVFISAVASAMRITPLAIRRTCRTLKHIEEYLSMLLSERRPLALTQARHYFDLFHGHPEAVLTLISERGAVFSIAEYENVFRLLRDDSNDDIVDSALQRLRDIF